jgi:hypothetical protein
VAAGKFNRRCDKHTEPNTRAGRPVRPVLAADEIRCAGCRLVFLQPLKSECRRPWRCPACQKPKRATKATLPLGAPTALTAPVESVCPAPGAAALSGRLLPPPAASAGPAAPVEPVYLVQHDTPAAAALAAALG